MCLLHKENRIPISSLYCQRKENTLKVYYIASKRLQIGGWKRSLPVSLMCSRII